MSKHYMKYQGVNPLEKLHPCEPYFFIRAQDKLAPAAVQAYADLLKAESDKALAAGNEQEGNELLKAALGVIKFAQTVVDWQLDNPEFVKTPD